jgi:predicted RNA binding protein YcfA (HicA-like mRNA interferase family)
MEESFSIPVAYKGIDMEFEARLQVFGYSHRFLVSIEGSDVFFERDEEGHYRAVIPPEHPGKVPSTGLLQQIAQAIEQILS